MVPNIKFNVLQQPLIFAQRDSSRLERFAGRHTHLEKGIQERLLALLHGESNNTTDYAFHSRLPFGDHQAASHCCKEVLLDLLRLGG